MAGTDKTKVDSESKPQEKEVIKELNTKEVIKYVHFLIVKSQVLMF